LLLVLLTLEHSSGALALTCEDAEVELVNSILGPSQREGALAALADHEFDVLVIGGGVTGAGCALDAASRGLSVALIEMRDWAAGTSSRSGKLFHGGLRYLEQFNFGLVREALKERGLMLEKLCPHLVRPIEFIYPIEHRIWERAYMGAGLFLYDTIGGAGAVPRHKQLSRKQVLERAPGLSRKSLVGGISFFDAQVDDSRHTLELVRTAAAYGAVAATALKVIGISHDQAGAVNGVNVKDLENGSQFHISAKTVINATGVWTDSLQKMAGGISDFAVQASKGVHILVPRDRIDSEVSVFVRAEDSVLFIRTWGAHWLIGTTDTPWELGLDHPAASATDIEYLLRNVNRVLNVELTVDDIDGVYAGLRPLIKGKEGATSDLSREHAVETTVPGFTTIAGGKYTTYRIMAEDAVNAAIVDLESRGLVQGVPQSDTEDVLLIGATNFDQVQTELRATGKNFGLNAKGIEHLLGRYGSMVGDLISILKYRPELAQPIAGGAGYLRVEALYAVTHEGALHIDDILTRRTHLSIETPDQGLEAAEEVAQIMGAELGWNQERTEAELVHYQDRVAAERKAHLAVDDSGAMAARNHVRDVRLTKV
jgi:glycerol-3-phosphate dehydrogenase